MKSIILLIISIQYIRAEYINGVGFRCGRDFNNDICPESLCCSQWGYCGNTSDYCNVGCQSNCVTTTSTISPPVTTSPVSTLISFTSNVSPPVTSIVYNVYPVITPIPVPTPVSASIFRDSCNRERTIALTFDDGISDLTNDLLTYLSNNKIPATFFIIGNKINTYRLLTFVYYKKKVICIYF